MNHLQIDRLPLHCLNDRSCETVDVVFVVPAGEEVRGVGVDKHRGLFLLMKSNERIFPVLEQGDCPDICRLRMLAIDVEDIDDIRVMAMIHTQLGIGLDLAV